MPDDGPETPDPGGTHRKPDNTGPLFSRQVLTGVFLVVVGLLVGAVLIGLVRDQVNVDGLVIALTPVITGVILGSAIRSKPKDDEK